MLIAIYSRKSKWTGKGESVENQLTMCKEYIRNVVEGGNEAEIIEYEDEGFSGKNTKRPQFQKMMKDMENKHYDLLVCYKLDRMGRNLADLANLMEKLAKMETSFISIKEKFDTTSPAGKAMLYFSGILAQMEREQIAERVRDNMVMLARSGRWLGGTTPLGFKALKQEKDVALGRKKVSYFLQEDEDEIKLVKFIFSYYMKERAITKVVDYLLRNGIKTRKGKDFAVSGIRDILTNPVYCIADECSYNYFYELGCQVCIDKEELNNVNGLVAYAKTASSKYKNQATSFDTWVVAMGKHKGIVTGEEFVKVQKMLEENKHKGNNFKKLRNTESLLGELLYCTCGRRMRPKNYPASRVNEKGERTFAYVCSYKEQTHKEKCENLNVHGNTIDDVVTNEIMALIKVDNGIIALLEELKKKIRNEDSLLSSEKQFLYEEYERKKAQINNLVKSLKTISVDSVSIQYINDEINLLDSECRELKKSMAEKEDEDQEKEEMLKYICDIQDKWENFPEMFAKLSIHQKRDFLKGVIEKIVWDGKVAHIYLISPVHKKHRTFLYLLEGNKKQWFVEKLPLQNHRISTPTWAYDSYKFTRKNLKGYIFKSFGFTG